MLEYNKDCYCVDLESKNYRATLLVAFTLQYIGTVRHNIITDFVILVNNY